MKNSLTSHKYNLGLKKSFFLQHLQTPDPPAVQFVGMSLSSARCFYVPVDFQTGVAPAHTVSGAGLRVG